MIHLSAFADEISPDLNEQIAVLRSEGIGYLDLRGVWGTNVLDLTDEQVEEIQRALEREDLRVAAIASPIGKVPLDSSFDEHLHRFERALTLARLFGAPAVRLFSFYPPRTATEADNWSAGRDEVVRRLREMTARAGAAAVTLTLENEKGIYADTIARNLDLCNAIDDPHLVIAFDPANFIQCGQTPYPDAYEALWRRIGYVHVKDALADGQVVVAGAGLSRWADLLQRLRADGYDGILSLEPHLAAAGTYSGFSGPDLFRQAAQALKQLLSDLEWPYA